MVYEENEFGENENNNGVYLIPDSEGGYAQIKDVGKLGEYNLQELQQIYHNTYLDIQRYNMLDDLCIESGLYGESELELSRDILLMEMIEEIPIMGILNTEELIHMLLLEHLTEKGFDNYQEELTEKFRMVQEKTLVKES